MSRTLFWYVLRDLLRIFMMTSLVLAGIMSFGGLIKPLTQYGLSGTQVGQVLLYFMPATQTYSLPIAALFATTVVYGRLSSDNELTACRATGVSYLSMALPAMVLGLVLALLSLISLAYVVPYYTLKVEKVAFASLAEVVEKNIQRSHQLRIDTDDRRYTIFAESAELEPPDAARPGEEVVTLYSPMFCMTEQDENSRIEVPSEFYTASSARVVIHQDDEQPRFSATLVGGVKFPRSFTGRAATGGLGVGEVVGLPIPSLIRENTKFLSIAQLKEVHHDPMKSRRIRDLYNRITCQEQEAGFVTQVYRAMEPRGRVGLVDPGHSYRFQGDGQLWTLSIEGPARISRSRSQLTFSSDGGARAIRLSRGGNMQPDLARQITLVVQSDQDNDRLNLGFKLENVQVGAGTEAANRPSFSRPLSVRTPSELLAIKQRGPSYYVNRDKLKADDPRRGEESKALRDLQRRLGRLRSGIDAEIHSRASFAISCLILVMMGCALGMMFRTGNYLSAFALSVIPALLCIALIVTGQHVAENDAGSLNLGLGLIWGGNVAVLVLAVMLLGRLQRQ